MNSLENNFFKEMMSKLYLRNIHYAAFMGVYKTVIYMYIFILNGFNISILNKWSEQIRGNSHKFLSKSTLGFVGILLLTYFIVAIVRSIYTYKIANRSAMLFAESDNIGKGNKSVVELKKHYKEISKKNVRFLGNLSNQFFRDLDYLTLAWTTILFPISYNYEAIIPEIKELYKKEDNKTISYRASLAYRDKSDKGYAFTLGMWLINCAIPISLMHITIFGLGGKYIELSGYVIVGMMVINTITYNIIKFRHLSWWLANNTIEVERSKFAKEKRTFVKGLVESFKDGFK